MPLPTSAEMRLGLPEPDDAIPKAHLEVQVALSLAQASLNALMNLSPLAYREVGLALKTEAARLNDRRDPSAALTAALLTQYMPA